MNPFGALIEAAVAHAVSSNPKLFDPKKLERAPEVLARDALKFMTKSTKEGEAEAPAEAEAPPFEPVLLDAPLAKAYRHLRIAAGCIARPQLTATSVYVPREANNAAVLAFADVPAQAQWKPVSKAQQTAWHEFFERVLPGANRRPLGDATPLPWPWPPSKEGKTYDADTQEEMPAP